MIRIFRTIYLVSWLCFLCFSCVITKYVNYENDCLSHNPNWKIYADMRHLKDLLIRVDSLNHKGTVKKNLGNRVVNFEFFELFTTMNRELPKPAVPNSNLKPRFVEKNIQINLYVSDTLDEQVIKILKKDESNDNIEKGYIGHNNFLYINNYQSGSYWLVNLHTKIAYKLEQDEENLQYTYRALKDFVKNGCYQGIQILTGGGVFSFGDTLGF